MIMQFMICLLFQLHHSGLYNFNATVREELKERNPGYEVRRTNIVVHILGGFDRGLMDELSKIISKVAAKRALEAMQKTILLHTIRLIRLIRSTAHGGMKNYRSMAIT